MKKSPKRRPKDAQNRQTHGRAEGGTTVHPNPSTAGRPVIWHGQAVLGGTAVPRGTAVPCVPRAQFGFLGLFIPVFASFLEGFVREASWAAASTPTPWLFESNFRLELELGLE